jgi:TRAP-type C4-dicarboxylate transport system substrate-binding protein
MKKSIVGVLVLSMLIALLTGCGGASSSNGSDTQAENASSSDTSSAPDDGEVYEVTFATQELETTFHSQIVQQLWANKIEEASNGRIKFVYYWSNSFCDVRDLLDNCESGALDAFWAASSAFAGRYVAYMGLTLPGLGFKTSPEVGEAMWNWLQEEECAQERGTAVLAACYPTGDTTINNSVREIQTAADFKGLRLRAPNSAWQAVLERLGAVPMSYNLPDAYDNISKNVSDGLLMDYQYLYFNRFYEIAPYTFAEPLSTNVGTIYVSQHFLDRLPEDLRQIVLDAGGVELCKAAGEFMEEKAEQLQLDWTEAGGTVYNVSEEVGAALDDAYEAGIEKWIAECDAKGYDGQELYNRLITMVTPYLTD